ncbi:MAG: arsenate reductase ArsC [Cellvibrionaceae bacterium]
MKSRVLFICTGNSARSQMAEGLLRHMADGLFDVYSAGTQPRGLHPLAVEVMRLQGMDISHQQSTPLQTYQNDSFDYVITLCHRAHEACPSVKGRFDTIHWAVDDPAAGNRLLDFQLALKELKTRLAYLVIIEEKRRTSKRSAPHER